MRRSVWLMGGLVALALFAIAKPAPAAGLDDFKLARAIPADTMLVWASRGHEGRKFLDEQWARVMAAIERAQFQKELRTIVRAGVAESGQDPEEFEAQWDKLSEIAGQVDWAKLGAREFAFAMRLGSPWPEFVILCMPPEDKAGESYEKLTALAKALSEMAPEGQIEFSSEGEGPAAMSRLALAGQMPLALTLARQKDVLMVGFGTGLVEQSLALLRGETGGTLVATDRFKQAMQRLPAPQDGFFYMDVTRIMGQARTLVDMLLETVSKTGSDQPVDAAENEAAAGPAEQMAFLKPLINQLDLWDYLAGVTATEGMKTTNTQVVVLREEAKDLPLYKAFYAGKPLENPLKYVPAQATAVGAMSQFDLKELYNAIVGFIRKEVPDGEGVLAQFETAQEEIEFNIEEDLLSWLGSSLVTFSSARRQFSQDAVYILGVRDEAAAKKTLDDLSERLNEALLEQKGAVEDADIEGAEGFRVVVLPPGIAFMLPISQPAYGIKDGRLFIATSVKALTSALEAGAGAADNFTKSERYKEGLPLPDKLTGYSYADLSRLGEQINAQLGMVLTPIQLMGGGGKDPATNAMFGMLRKVGLVAKSLDFLQASYAVTTFDGKASLTKKLVLYQEPKPAKPEAAPSDSEAAPGEAKPDKPAEPTKE